MTPDLEPLLGRDEDLAQILRRIDEARLVTLTGPGGSGKTRLAEAALAALSAGSRDAYFVDASGVREPALLASAVTAALRLDGSADQSPVEAVRDAIADRDVVLVLDNLEQVDGGGGATNELLAAAPRLRILATSRVPLAVSGEIPFPVGPLALPATADAAEIEASPAGALFLERSRTLGRSVQLDEAGAAAVHRLLHRLDGLPLAIELAAARTRILGPHEIDRWLAERGVAAVDTSGGAPHRSMRAILEYTMDLLSTDQGRALRALSVAGGVDLDLAQALVPDIEMVDVIDSLVTLGLVQHAGSMLGATRFRLLETIRAEVARGLDAEERARSHNRHAEAMSSIAAMHERVASSVLEPRTLIRLDADADNFRIALEWLERASVKQYLILWHDLKAFWESRLRQREGVARFERVLATNPEWTIDLSRAMSRYVGLRFGLDGRLPSKDVNARALELARAVGDRPSEVEALTGVAMIAVTEGDPDAAEEASHLAMRISRELGDPAVTAMAAQVGVFAVQSVHGADSDEMRDALVIAERAAAVAGFEELEMTMTGNLAVVHVYRGEYADAVTKAERATETARRRDHPLFGWCVSTLALALAETGAVDRAIEAIKESVQHAAILDVADRTDDTLTAAAAVALAAEQPLLAARCYGVATARYADGSAEEQPENRVLLDGILARARKRARPIDLELALRDGATTPVADLLRTLPEELASAKTRRHQADGNSRIRHADLTRREMEIFALVGKGRSDREIAEALFISPKTASVHVVNIKGKLGVDSRLEVALRARDLGLV